MAKCKHPTCSAEITFAIRLKTLKTQPLVPYDPAYGDTPRYVIKERSDGQLECELHPEGGYMSHFVNCPGAPGFSKRKGGR